MKPSPRFVIRCGTPDYEWGFPMPDLGELALDSCYSTFRKHCMETPGLRQDNVADCAMHLDLEKWTLNAYLARHLDCVIASPPGGPLEVCDAKTTRYSAWRRSDDGELEEFFPNSPRDPQTRV